MRRRLPRRSAHSRLAPLVAFLLHAPGVPSSSRKIGRIRSSRCLLGAKYSSDTLQKRVRTKRVHIERMVRSMSHWTREMDLQLVNLVNHQSKKKGFRPLSQHPSQLSISATELRDYSKLQTLSIGTIYQRLALLQLLNHLVDGLIVWIDTSNV